MDVQAICSVVACIITVGGVLIYIGRSLQTQTTQNEALKVLFACTDNHGKDIVRIDKDVIEIKTRQSDCDNCP